MGCETQVSKAPAPAPVVALPMKASQIPSVYIVKKGDSLYSIAWTYDMDVKKIASLNHIDAVDRIYIGQKLHLKTQAPIKHTPTIVRKKPVAPKKEPTLITKAPQTKQVQVQKEKEAKTATLSKSEKWLFPTTGNVVKSFSLKNKDFNKGIDISGTLNSAIKATKSGKVVYSGEGLRGYGKLLIVKHDDSYLSAYAHNNQLLVKEGDFVKQGQTIAKMGKSGSQTVKLHFQIRKDGKPVDPQKYVK